VKIAPAYKHPAIHVLDASRSVVVVSSLLDANNKDVRVTVTLYLVCVVQLLWS